MSYTSPIRVQIIQPLIPDYRVPLFQRLGKHDNLRLKVCASRTLPYKDYPSTVEMGDKYVDLEHPCIGFFRNQLIWQRKLKLDPDMGEGDVLVVSGNLRFISNIKLIWKAKRKRVSVVWWGHGFSKRRNRFKDAINRIVMHFIDVRLLYTDKEVEEYKRLGFSANKLFATNNALDQEPIRKAKAAWGTDKLKEFQHRENIEGKDILLFCGRRTKSVSLEVVFAALAQLREKNDNYLFVIIGPDDSGGVLGEKARELGVEDCIRWLGPMYNQHDLAPWFLSACCFVFPGAIGLSLLHAFFYALPVIVPDCTHNPEIAAFSDGENGLFYKDGNVDDLRDKITTITDHQEYHKKLSAKALQVVENDYNMNAMANRYVEAIIAAANRFQSNLYSR
jgi:glycosyltransferase involved in cell wall biosynthesis